MDITRCLVGVSVGAEREREKRGLTYSCCTAEEEERIRSEVLTCAAAALNTGNGEESESNALFSEIWAAPTTFDS